MRSFIICTLHQLLLGGLIKEDEVNSTCNTQTRMGEMRNTQKILVGNLKGEITQKT